MTLRGVRKHQWALQRIADRNDGNRFSGFSGYDASVRYVVRKLKRAGYDPEVQEFDYLAYEEVGSSALQQTAPTPTTYVEGTDFAAVTQTDPGDVTAPVQAVDLALGLGNASTSGCEAADFAGFTAGEHRAAPARHLHVRDQGRECGSGRRRRHRDLQPGQHGRSGPPGHPGRHADGQQHRAASR